MKEFFVENWKLIIICFCAVLELVSVIVCMVLYKKKPGAVSPIYQVISRLPSMIIDVERIIGSGKGTEKKSVVLEVAIDLYKTLTGIKLTEDSKIVRMFNSAIEEILTTPQKKGVKND